MDSGSEFTQRGWELHCIVPASARPPRDRRRGVGAGLGPWAPVGGTRLSASRHFWICFVTDRFWIVFEVPVWRICGAQIDQKTHLCFFDLCCYSLCLFSFNCFLCFGGCYTRLILVLLSVLLCIDVLLCLAAKLVSCLIIF